MPINICVFTSKYIKIWIYAISKTTKSDIRSSHAAGHACAGSSAAMSEGVGSIGRAASYMRA